jgi:DNA-binding transcriptional MocR family regulator
MAEVMRRTPRYRAIASRIEQAIADGVYEPGERIASIRELADSFDASINTLRAAFGLLQERGVIETRPRSGAYVVYQPVSAEESDYVDDVVDAVIEEYACRPLPHPATERMDIAVIPPELVPSRQIRAAMHAVAQQGHPLLSGFATFERTMELRSRISQWEMAHGTSVHPDHLVLASSIEHAVMQLLILLNPARLPVAVQSPTYYGHLTILRALGMPVFELPVAADGSFSVARLSEAVDRKQIGLALLDTAVHNPTGSSVPDSVLNGVAALTASGRLRVIEYGMLRDMRFGASDTAPLYSRAPSGSVYLCSSYAETMVPSIKAAWVAAGQGAPYLRDRWRATACTVSALQLGVLEHLLASRQIRRHVEAIRRAVRGALGDAEELVVQSFPRGTHVSRPAGGFALWVALPAGISGKQIFRTARDRGIAIAPGTMFAPHPDDYDNHIRIAPGVLAPSTRRAIRELGAIVARRDGATR